MSDQDDHLNDVAIVGMELRVPGASTLEGFWENLRQGVETITILSPEAPVVHGGVAHVKAAPLLDDIELFDASFFGFNPREAETMDPQIRLFLECAWTVLEAAGYDSQQYAGRIGVFAGSAMSTYLTQNLLLNPEAIRAAGAGMSSLGVFNDRDSLATIVAYKFDLTGPAITVQTFCSTSLVAVHLACQSLLNGESDLALAGASSVNVGLGGGYLYQEGGILSPDGHCRSFDEKAAGTVFGNGVGVVALKRLADALADGDTIHAVIRGSAINNDGAQKAGYTAPSVVGQTKAIAEAMAVARVSPDSISYVEAHGTATALGDPIEIEALTRAFRAGTQRKGYCAIGSLKANLGHLDRAAGVASLVKTALMMKHQAIPPLVHFERPNPKIDFENSPFQVNTRLAEWRTDGSPRRAGISSLGVGGTNAHLILEEAPSNPPSGPGRPAQLMVLSARTESSLEAATLRLVRHLRSHSDQNLGDVAFTLLAGRRRFEHRRILVAEDAIRAADALESLDPKRVYTTYSRAMERPVVFMFPGQGAQYVDMARGLYEQEAVFRKTLDECCERLKPTLGLDLRSVLYPSPDHAAEAADRLGQTAITQPALFVVEYALARLWMSWGIQPQAMIGHSVGEYVAAHLAGVLTLADAMALVAERGRLMQSMPPGSMLAVPLPAGEVEDCLRDGVALAAVNGPSYCVLSGPSPAIEAIEADLKRRNVPATRLHTSHAFHSPMMDPILAPFRERMNAVRLAPPRLPYVSDLSGTWITEAEATSPDYWVRHLRGTVHFAEGIRTLWAEPERLLLEVGPGNALGAFARQQAARSAAPSIVSSLRHPREVEGDLPFLLSALGRLWASGVRIDAARIFAGEQRRRVSLPTYSFERERYWVEADPARAALQAAAAKKDPADWFYLPTWKSALPAEAVETRNGSDSASGWLLFVDEGGFGDRLAQRLREQGDVVVTVRPGSVFSGNARTGFVIDPRAREQYQRVLEATSQEGRRVERIVHGFAVGPERAGTLTPEQVAQAQDLGYYSLLYLAQTLAGRAESHPLQLKLLTSQMHDVLQGDVPHPEKATMLGLVKVVPQELHHVTCSAVDVEAPQAPTWSDVSALDGLLLELRTRHPGTVVAVRRRQRFVLGYEPLRLPLPEARPRLLREGGVYLITGGLGGVTFILGAYLAHVAKAKLVLTGRARLPERGEWAEWRRSHGDADPVSQRIVRAESLEQLGAEVLVVAADVADSAQMEEAFRQAEARFGPVHGVIHGAGIVGGDSFRPIPQIGPSECEQQFHPKIAGLLALDRVLAGREIDFCMLTSSLSSVLGGFAYAAYAAGNIFMDAFTQARNQRGRPRWLSVDWDEWRLAEPPDEAGRGAGLAQFAMGALEGAGAFARLLDLAGVSQVVVSTGDLQGRIEKWIRLEALRGDRNKGAKESEGARHPRPHLQNAYVAPGKPSEQKIARIWAELLGVEKVGIQDNFFDLGGHSLLAIQVITKIKAELAAEVSVATLFEGPTVESLARLIGRETEETQEFEHSSARGRRRKDERRRRQQGTEGLS
ncbi:MAG TPA: SDR family NAD(P)-dependent oxidoreductase [Vicinamibacteria bacterium]|nr:SDR family NAD(P)-dependent oxidoreductase [Vicinamibacteria bacterium]